MNINLLHGDCLYQMKTLPDNSVDSIVTDPPYGLSFMGKSWDYEVPKADMWREALRVLKPGGHLLAFFGARTYHRGVVNIEDAGFEIRDQIMWIYGSGFPKSHNIGKAIDKSQGLQREIIKGAGAASSNTKSLGKFSNDAISNDAKQWDGWGTALKPANEPIVVARKPLEKGLTIAENVLKWGCGAINIDESRIGTEIIKSNMDVKAFQKWKEQDGREKKEVESVDPRFSTGRWPANIMFDEAAASVLDEQSGNSKSSSAKRNNKPSENIAMSGANLGHVSSGHDDFGGASRFFYVAKASKSERNKGLEGMPLVESGIKNDSGRGFSESDPHKKILNQNHHPTVKPIKLMQYLIKLVTPPNGTVLDPFMGSGSTGVAAKSLGFNFIGCEMNAEYLEIAKKRIESNEQL